MQEMQSITNFQSEAAITNNDCNYCPSTSNGEILRVWAGPSHWKFKHIRQVARRFTGTSDIVKEKQVKDKTRKKQIEELSLDFSCASYIDEKLFDMSFKRKRRPLHVDINK